MGSRVARTIGAALLIGAGLVPLDTVGPTVAGAATSLGLTKTAAPSTDVVAGDVVTYTFTGTNTGTTTLHNVGVTDPLPGLSAVSCAPAAPAALAPSATISCTATYTVTQANVDAGSFSNTATIDGLDPTDTPVSKTASRTVIALQTGALSLTKSASPGADVVAGNVVTYTFAGKNTGTMTLHNVNVTDPMPGLSALSCSPATPTTLAPNATISCSATYTVTQANVDTGSYTNTATIAGLDPNSATVASNASKTVIADQTAALSITKTASPNSGVVTGDVVTSTINAQNSGSVTLHAVTVTDPTAVIGTCTPALPVATLAPAGTISCTATHTVTQADVDAGSFTNTATVTGLDPSDSTVSESAEATVTANQTHSLGFSKTATPTTGVLTGGVVTYTFSGQNTGTTTLHNVTVTDPMVGLSTITCTPTTPATLAPGDTIDCTAAYTVTQNDVDAGSIVNTATVTGLDPNNTPTTNTAGATVTTDQTGSLSLTKSASPPTGAITGAVVTYTFSGQNTGTTTLHNVTVTDPMVGLSTIACTPTTPATLAPGATINCTATYTVTQTDVDAGSIINTATIAGLDPNNTPTTNTAGATVTTDQTGSLSLTKSASPSTGVLTGGVVTYTFTGRNTGTTTLHNVTVTDPLPGLSTITCTPTTPATLAPGDTIGCTATYTVTQADVDGGPFTNTATVTGLDPSNNPVTKNASATVTPSTVASLALTKTASPTSGPFVGDTVTYTMTAANTGAVSLHTVAITDPMVGLSPLTCTPTAGSSLAPNATMTCTATYTVTQADVDNGSITNTAAASGTDPVGNPTTATDSATVNANQAQPIDPKPAGEPVKPAAANAAGAGFAFTGSEARRLCLVAVLGIVGGWTLVVAARKRDDDDLITEGSSRIRHPDGDERLP